MFSATLALLFLLRLRFGRDSTAYDVIRRNHGLQLLHQFRKLFDTKKKYVKCQLDIVFLMKCKTYKMFPKFLRFKLYKKCLHHKEFYRSWQTKLLNEELKCKRSRMLELSSEISNYSVSLKSRLSILEYGFVHNYVKFALETYSTKIKFVHEKKLKQLGICNVLEPCNPDKVIFNFSSKQLAPRIKTLLAFGLDFGLPVHKLSFYDYFLSFEKLASSLRNHTVSSPFTFHDVQKQLHTIAYKYFYGFKPFKVFSPIFNKCDIQAIKSFASDKSIVVSRPDKGKGVVILNRCDYVDKMNTILSDRSKFKAVSAPILQTLTRLEDKINRFLGKLKRLGMITESVYNELFVSGSMPGVLYGLPKIHKLNVPLRPIFAACGTPAYKLAKYLVPILTPLTKNSYTVSNSYEFAQCLKSFNNTDELFMVSYDVESLFTNIPLYETIDICIRCLFESCEYVMGLTKELFKTFMELSVLNSHFVFNGNLYVQQEGVGMGLPLGPTCANAFMCFHERNWLGDCPSEFSPVLYRRYVDDSFVLFRSHSHAVKFFDYINSKHPNIKFTMEMEKDGQLSFLDVNVRKSCGKFVTSVYRKPTFTGLGTSFFSFISTRFKRSVITTLIHRAYALCSSFTLVNNEFNFIKSFLVNNGFPDYMIESSIRKFLDNIYNHPTLSASTVPKLKQYFVFPYFGAQSEKLRHELTSILTNFYPYMDVNIVLVNRFKIGSFFKVKDRLPIGCQSSVVYLFSCASCDASYIGSTKRALHNRFEQHKGRSFRTGLPLARPDPSAVRSHSELCGTGFTLDNFKIIGKCTNIGDLRLLESLCICKQKPNLNDNTSAVPLYVV